MSALELSSEILDIVPFVMQLIRTEMRSSAKPNLTIAQFRMLARLSRGPQTNKDLAEWIGISTPTASRTIDGLVRRNFVKRETGAADRREVRLLITKSGLSEFERIKAAAKASFAARLQELSADQEARIRIGLQALREVVAR